MKALLLAAAVFAVAAPAHADDVTVEIVNFAFIPKQVTIAPGTRVTWINRDVEPHTVVTPDKKLKSPPLETGDSYSFVFSDVGATAYICSIHPHMQGAIVVK